MPRMLILVIALAVIGPISGWPTARGPDRPDSLVAAASQPISASRLFRERLDINEATEADLVSLPGIGPTRARAILTRRREVGGFHDVDELRGVHGIGPKTLARITPLVTVTVEDGHSGLAAGAGEEWEDGWWDDGPW
jgi:competence protein ComEA